MGNTLLTESIFPVYSKYFLLRTHRRGGETANMSPGGCSLGHFDLVTLKNLSDYSHCSLIHMFCPGGSEPGRACSHLTHPELALAWNGTGCWGLNPNTWNLLCLLTHSMLKPTTKLYWHWKVFYLNRLKRKPTNFQIPGLSPRWRFPTAVLFCHPGSTTVSHPLSSPSPGLSYSRLLLSLHFTGLLVEHFLRLASRL